MALCDSQHVWVHLTLNGLAPVAVRASICTALLAPVICHHVQAQKTTAECKLADYIKEDTSAVIVLPFNCHNKHKALKGTRRKYQRKYTAPVSESSIEWKDNCLQTHKYQQSVLCYCQAVCMEQSSRCSELIRHISAFTYNENKHGYVSRPADIPDYQQDKWLKKWLFMQSASTLIHRSNIYSLFCKNTKGFYHSSLSPQHLEGGAAKDLLALCTCSLSSRDTAMLLWYCHVPRWVIHLCIYIDTPEWCHLDTDLL